METIVLHVLWVRAEGGGVCTDVVVHDWTDHCGGKMWDVRTAVSFIVEGS